MKNLLSRDNPTFKSLRALANNIREQRKSGHTLLEGPHLVAAYLDKVDLPLRLLVSESGLAQREVQLLLKRCEGVATLNLRDTMFRDLAGTETPVGILAEIAIPECSAGTVTGTCVLLDAVQDAGNVGAILRTAAAAGVRDIILGSGCAAVWSPKVLRAGQGAHFDLFIRERVDLPSFLETHAGLSIATVARDGTSPFELDLTGPVAWVFGNEGAGVSEKSALATRQRATIPLAPGCESLNVAAAAAICLFEERRQKLCRMNAK